MLHAQLRRSDKLDEVEVEDLGEEVKEKTFVKVSMVEFEEDTKKE